MKERMGAMKARNDIIASARPHRSLLFIAGSIIAGVVGYLFSRELYLAGAKMPFAQEAILVFAGAIATIFLTAALLNRQTELELSKEGRVLLFDKKNEVYMGAIEMIADIVEKQRHDPELIDELRILNHKLAVIGSAHVIENFNEVLNRLHRGLRDGNLSDADAREVMMALARLTCAMRRDMLDEVAMGDRGGEQERVSALILRNSRQSEDLDDLEEALLQASARSRGKRKETKE